MLRIKKLQLFEKMRSFCVTVYYILCISWIIKCLIIIDARCKHGDIEKKISIITSNSSSTEVMLTNIR